VDINNKSNLEKQQILKNQLHELLRSGAAEDSIRSFVYDETRDECIIRLSVHEVKEDNYIGFGSY